MRDGVVLVTTCCRLRPWWAIHTQPRISVYQADQELDPEETGLDHRPRAVRGAWTVGRLAEQTIAALVFEWSRARRTQLHLFALRWMRVIVMLGVT